MIFASGGGSNFIAIHKNILKGEISNANIEGLISNNPKCGAVSYAINNNIRTYIINSFRHKTDENISNRLIEILEEISKDTSLMYENLITEQKNSFSTHIQDIETKLKSMRKMEDDILLEDSYDLDTLHGDFDNYMKYQAYYFNADNLEFKYCDSKDSFEHLLGF